jgi:hypothetical protein
MNKEAKKLGPTFAYISGTTPRVPMKNFGLLFIFFFCFASAQAQQVPEFEGKDTGAIIKALYLYSFSKIIDWPSEYKQGNFVISVMGGGNLHQELVKRYNEKQIGSQQIEIRKLSKTVNISRCHVLFIGKEHVDMIEDICKALEGQATLIITEQTGALELGAVLNFVVEDANYKFELSVENADKHKLFVGSTIKSLAIRY